MFRMIMLYVFVFYLCLCFAWPAQGCPPDLTAELSSGFMFCLKVNNTAYFTMESFLSSKFSFPAYSRLAFSLWLLFVLYVLVSWSSRMMTTDELEPELDGAQWVSDSSQGIPPMTTSGGASLSRERIKVQPSSPASSPVCGCSWGNLYTL